MRALGSYDASNEETMNQPNENEDNVRFASDHALLRKRDPRLRLEQNTQVVEGHHVSHTIHHAQIRRTRSNDSFSSLSTTTGSPVERCSQKGVMILWKDGVTSPIESPETTCVQLGSFQESTELSEPATMENKKVDEPNEELMSNHLGDSSNLSADILLAKRIFSTLGMPRQYSCKVKHFFEVPVRARRSVLRRTYSAGLDPYLRAPERLTRFEI